MKLLAKSQVNDKAFSIEMSDRGVYTVHVRNAYTDIEHTCISYLDAWHMWMEEMKEEVACSLPEEMMNLNDFIDETVVFPIKLRAS